MKVVQEIRQEKASIRLMSGTWPPTPEKERVMTREKAAEGVCLGGHQGKEKKSLGKMKENFKKIRAFFGGGQGSMLKKGRKVGASK